MKPKYKCGDMVLVPAIVERVNVKSGRGVRTPWEQYDLIITDRVDYSFPLDSITLTCNGKFIFGSAKFKLGELVLAKNQDGKWDLAYFLAHIGKHKLEYVVETQKRDDWYGAEEVKAICFNRDDDCLVFEMNGKTYQAIEIPNERV